MAESLTIEIAADGVLPVRCPAGLPLAAVRQHGSRVGCEVPGVLCRVVGEPVDLASDPTSVGVFCCHPDQGHRRCPVWQEDKRTIAVTGRSLALAGEMDEANDRALRDDLTGSPYGDISFLDALSDAARDAQLDMKYNDDGFVHGHGGDE